MRSVGREFARTRMQIGSCRAETVDSLRWSRYRGRFSRQDPREAGQIRLAVSHNDFCIL